MGGSIMKSHARNPKLFSLQLLDSHRLLHTQTPSKRLAIPHDNGACKLEAVSDATYSRACKWPFSFCTVTVFSYLPSNQLIETSSSITPHPPRKLDACDFRVRVCAGLLYLILSSVVKTVSASLRRKKFAVDIYPWR